jgi:hypothetical protein
MVYNEAMPPDYPQQTPPSLPPNNYDFIMQPAQAPKQSLFKLPGGGNHSIIIRIGLIAGGLIVLIILFSIVKSILIKGPDLSGYVTVAQDQQELIHLFSGAATNTTSLQALSTNDQNLTATASASLSSNQSQIITYLSNNHQKIKTKVLNLKINSALDSQLTTAQTAGTYEQTFQTVVQAQLSNYLKDLMSTYQSSSGKKGRALLKSLYAQAVLLQGQANSTSD